MVLFLKFVCCDASGDSLFSERDRENSLGGEREGRVGEKGGGCLDGDCFDGGWFGELTFGRCCLKCNFGDTARCCENLHGECYGLTCVVTGVGFLFLMGVRLSTLFFGVSFFYYLFFLDFCWSPFPHAVLPQRSIFTPFSWVF